METAKHTPARKLSNTLEVRELHKGIYMIGHRSNDAIIETFQTESEAIERLTLLDMAPETAKERDELKKKVEESFKTIHDLDNHYQSERTQLYSKNEKLSQLNAELVDALEKVNSMLNTLEDADSIECINISKIIESVLTKAKGAEPILIVSFKDSPSETFSVWFKKDKQ